MLVMFSVVIMGYCVSMEDVIRLFDGEFSVIVSMLIFLFVDYIFNIMEIESFLDVVW